MQQPRPIIPTRSLSLLFALIFSGIMLACGEKHTAVAAAPSPLENEDFRKYWFSGEAELNRYRLSQARYGELHQGEAVLIFVTEEFLPKEQVKYEGGPPRGKLPVLKLNFTKKFYTGVYPYSIMSSIFTPADTSTHNRSMKITTSAQEWCGHVYTQYNLRGDQYEIKSHSYFMNEADQEFELGAADPLEDDVWTRLRLAPESLPGTETRKEIRMVPGTQYLRLRHREPAPERAVVELKRGAPSHTYVIEYPELNRRLAIEFEADFPHAILGWTESHTSGFGASATTLTTTAERTHVLRLDYWNKNGNADAKYRERLGLTER